MSFHVTLVNDFQIKDISYEDDKVVFWMKNDWEHRKRVKSTDHVRELLQDLYDPELQGNIPHRESILMVYRPDGSQFNLKQYMTWEEQGIVKPLIVVRRRLEMYKPAAAA